MRRVLRWVVLVVAIGCLVAFFSESGGTNISISESLHAGRLHHRREVSWNSIGEPWLWYESRMEQEVREGIGEVFSGQSRVIWNSPAWLVLGVAVAGFVAFRWLRPVSVRVLA